MTGRKRTGSSFSKRSVLMLCVLFAGIGLISTMGGFGKPEEGWSASRTPVAGVDYVQGEVIVTITKSYMPSESEVTLKPPRLGRVALDNVIEAYGGTALLKIVSTYNQYASEAGSSLERSFVLRYSADIDAVALAAELSQLSCFERVEPNQILHLEPHGTVLFVPGDTTAFSYQWYFDNADFGDSSDIDMPEAWAIEQGNPNLIIGIFDEGTMIDTTTNPNAWKLHNDFNFHWISAEDVESPGVLNGADLDGVDSNSDQEMSSGLHGTYNYASNIIGFNLLQGNDADTTEGVEYRKRFWYGVPHSWKGLMACNPPAPCDDPWGVTDWGRHGVWVGSIAAGKLDGLKPTTSPLGKDIVGIAHNCKVYNVRFNSNQTASDMASSVIHLAKVCDVVNMSFGGVNENSSVRAAFATGTTEHDCVFIASTGNDETNPASGVRYPARYDSVFAVGAITRSPVALTSYSVYSPNNEVVDAVATGNGLYTDGFTGCPDDIYPCAAAELTQTIGTGTSFAAPQAAGVAALIRSRFPALNQFQVKQRLKKSAEFYWNKNDPVDRRKYGAGKINAYRALTEWGTITANTTWGSVSGMPNTFYVSGDLTIDTGVTLTLNKGTTIRIAPDHEKSGDDPSRVQIIVKGTLKTGTAGSGPIVFESFTDGTRTPSDWVGIKFESTSTNNVLDGVTIRNAQVGIENHAPVALTACVIKECETGIESYDDFTIAKSTIKNVTDYGIQIFDGTATMVKDTISDSFLGVWALAGATVSCDSSLFQNLEYAALLASGDGTISVEDSHMDNTLYGVRFTLDNQGTVERCTITNSTGDGIYVDGATLPVIKNCVIDNSATNGIYCQVYGDLVIQGTTVKNSPVGVYCYAFASPTLKARNMIKACTTGLKCAVSSHPVVEETTIKENTTGVRALSGSNPDLGQTSGGPSVGDNVIESNTLWLVKNTTGIEIQAERNYWGSAAGPDPTKINGLVDYVPWLINKPEIEPEWEGVVAYMPPVDNEFPARYDLAYNYPNPFNPTTRIKYDVPSPGGVVQLVIYNIRGQRVAMLLDERRPPGVHTVMWDGRDDAGEPVATGVYFVQMRSGPFRETKKLVLLK